MEAGIHGADRHAQYLRHLRKRHPHEIAQHHCVAHLLGQILDGVAENPGIDLHENAVVSGVGKVLHVAGLHREAVHLAPDVLGVDVREYLAHPAEKGGLLKIVVDAVDDGSERAVHQLLGVALVAAKPPRKRHETALVFGLQAPCAALAVGPEFFYDRHGRGIALQKDNTPEPRKPSRDFQEKSASPKKAGISSTERRTGAPREASLAEDS